MNAAGVSQWVPIDYIESWFGVEVGVILSEDASGVTYSVQYTLDSLRLNPQGAADGSDNHVTIARAGTVATVTDNGPYGLGHGLSPGDSVIISGSGSTNFDSLPPTYGTGLVGRQVDTTPSSTTFTYTVSNTGPAADVGTTYITRQRIFTHSTLANLQARNNGTFNYPIRAVRLYLAALATGYVDMTVLQGSAA
jgi:hypothetical protein